MDVWTFWSQLLSCYAFYIVSNCIRNHHTELENERTILTYLIKKIKKAPKKFSRTDVLSYGRTDGLTLIVEKGQFYSDTLITS